MSNASALFLKGERSPLYVSESASVGTVQYTAPPTFSLYDASGAVVTGYDHVPVSGYTQGAAASIQAYFNLDTTNLAPGYFYALFMLAFLAQDGISRVRAYDFDVFVRAIDPVV